MAGPKIPFDLWGKSVWRGRNLRSRLKGLRVCSTSPPRGPLGTTGWGRSGGSARTVKTQGCAFMRTRCDCAPRSDRHRSPCACVAAPAWKGGGPGSVRRRASRATATGTPGALRFAGAAGVIRAAHGGRRGLVQGAWRVHAARRLELRHRRKPRLSFALPGALSLRYAERAFLASLIQEPPRTARCARRFHADRPPGARA